MTEMKDFIPVRNNIDNLSQFDLKYVMEQLIARVELRETIADVGEGATISYHVPCKIYTNPDQMTNTYEVSVFKHGDKTRMRFYNIKRMTYTPPRVYTIEDNSIDYFNLLGAAAAHEKTYNNY